MSSSASSVRGTYNGTSTVTLTTYDYCGPGSNRRVAGTQTYRLGSRLTIGQRVSGGGRVEPSPFSLTFAGGSPAAAGAVSLASARVANTSGVDLAGNPRDPRVLLTYWQLSWSNGRLTGQLINDHRAEGAAYNLFNGQRPLFACRGYSGGVIPDVTSLRTGTTLQGTLGRGHADLILRATTYNGLYAFTLHFVS